MSSKILSQFQMLRELVDAGQLDSAFRNFRPAIDRVHRAAQRLPALRGVRKNGRVVRRLRDMLAVRGKRLKRKGLRAVPSPRSQLRAAKLKAARQRLLERRRALAQERAQRPVVRQETPFPRAQFARALGRTPKRVAQSPRTSGDEELSEVEMTGTMLAQKPLSPTEAKAIGVGIRARGRSQHTTPRGLIGWR